MPRTKSVFFGPSPENPYDNGDFPCCAINANNIGVAIHEGTNSNTLNYRIFSVQDARVTFFDPPKKNFSKGYRPAVVLSDDHVVVEAHGTDKDSGNLEYQIGVLKDSTIGFSGSPARIGKGSNPSLAIDRAGHIVEVHERDKNLYYRLGRFDSASRRVEWPKDEIDLTKPGDRPTVGDSPSVAMNRNGQLVAVYVNKGRLFYLRGNLANKGPNGASIQWNSVRPYISRADTNGQNPSVALTDDGYLYEVHDTGSSLYQRVGRLADASGGEIIWQEWLDRNPANPLLDNFFDTGERVQIATNGKVAVQVHESESPLSKGVFANAALSFDHANWMGDHRDKILKRTLRDLALPSSHDSGAYLSGTLPRNLAQTQGFTIYGQLASGVRFFDLRPRYDGDQSQPFDRNQLFTHHGPIQGPLFTAILKDVQDFMREHNELVILKTSHYGNFNQNVFNGMAGLIREFLSSWLFDDTNKGQARLADRPMSDYLNLNPAKGTVLVVVDSDGDHNPGNNPPDREYLPDPRPAGFFRYRDWYATDPQRGDLTVFDVYSNTTDFNTMAEGTGPDTDRLLGVQRNGTPLPQGQLPKLKLFNGICRNQYTDKGVRKDFPCDLFLLSWTLTPTINAFTLSRVANQRLIDYGQKIGVNPSGRVANLIYTDVVQDSRSADLALIHNNLA